MLFNGTHNLVLFDQTQVEKAVKFLSPFFPSPFLLCFSLPLPKICLNVRQS